LNFAKRFVAVKGTICAEQDLNFLKVQETGLVLYYYKAIRGRKRDDMRGVVEKKKVLFFAENFREGKVMRIIPRNPVVKFVWFIVLLALSIGLGSYIGSHMSQSPYETKEGPAPTSVKSQPVPVLEKSEIAAAESPALASAKKESSSAEVLRLALPGATPVYPIENPNLEKPEPKESAPAFKDLDPTPEPALTPETAPTETPAATPTNDCVTAKDSSKL